MILGEFIAFAIEIEMRSTKKQKEENNKKDVCAENVAVTDTHVCKCYGFGYVIDSIAFELVLRAWDNDKKRKKKNDERDNFV